MWINKEETAAIRKELKETFPKTKFSVRGADTTLYVTIVKSDIDLSGAFILSPSEIRKMEWEGDSEESIKEKAEYLAASDTRSINKYFTSSYEEALGEAGYKFITKVIEIMERKNYDNSDVQTDYFDIGYCSSLSITNPNL